MANFKKKKFLIIWSKNSIYDSLWYNKFCNKLMLQGKKSFTNKNMFFAFKVLRKITTMQSLAFFEVIDSIKPLFILSWFRRGKQYFQVPRLIFKPKQYKVGIALFAKTVQNLKTVKFKKKVVQEFLNISYKKNSTILDFKQELYKIGIYNKALLHFRW